MNSPSEADHEIVQAFVFAFAVSLVGVPIAALCGVSAGAIAVSEFVLLFIGVGLAQFGILEDWGAAIKYFVTRRILRKQ